MIENGVDVNENTDPDNNSFSTAFYALTIFGYNKFRDIYGFDKVFIYHKDDFYHKDDSIV